MQDVQTYGVSETINIHLNVALCAQNSVITRSKGIERGTDLFSSLSNPFTSQREKWKTTRTRARARRGFLVRVKRSSSCQLPVSSIVCRCGAPRVYLSGVQLAFIPCSLLYQSRFSGLTSLLIWRKADRKVRRSVIPRYRVLRLERRLLIGRHFTRPIIVSVDAAQRGGH